MNRTGRWTDRRTGKQDRQAGGQVRKTDRWAGTEDRQPGRLTGGVGRHIYMVGRQTDILTDRQDRQTGRWVG